MDIIFFVSMFRFVFGLKSATILVYLHCMKLLLSSLLFFILVSCTNGNDKVLVLKKKKYNPFVINLAHTFSQNESNMSFPIWFADTIIKEKKIKKLTRHLYPSFTEGKTVASTPKESKEYFFNADGEVEKMIVNQFYEYVTVSSLTFDYSAQKDEFGYSPVDFEPMGESKNRDLADQYSIFEKVEYSDKFLVYRNEESGDYLFYMLNKKNWGALSVDSILRPTPSDRVAFGQPNKVVKSYNVENTVNEFGTVDYSYNSEYPTEIVSESFPFHHKRTIEYDEAGDCTGFVDSTFSGSKYLTRRKSNFVFKDNLPVRLIHESKSNNASRGFIQVEELKYEFFEE